MLGRGTWGEGPSPNSGQKPPELAGELAAELAEILPQFRALDPPLIPRFALAVTA